MLFLLINMDIMREIETPFFTIPRLYGYRGGELSPANIIKNVNVFKMIFTNDYLGYNSLSEYGTIYYISIPFAVLGIMTAVKNTMKSIKQKCFHLEVLILAAFLSVLICTMLVTGPNIYKANALYIPLIYFVVLGIMKVSKLKIGNRFRNLVLPAIIVIYTVFFISFTDFYFNKYPVEYKDQVNFDYELIELTKYLENIDYFEGRNIYFDTRDSSYVYFLNATLVSPKVYTQHSYTRNYYCGIPESYHDGAVYIAKYQEFADFFEKKGYKCLEYGRYKIMYK